MMMMMMMMMNVEKKKNYWKKYIIYQEIFTYENAKALCKAFDGRLAKISKIEAYERSRMV